MLTGAICLYSTLRDGITIPVFFEYSGVEGGKGLLLALVLLDVALHTPVVLRSQAGKAGLVCGILALDGGPKELILGGCLLFDFSGCKFGLVANDDAGGEEIAVGAAIG